MQDSVMKDCKRLAVNVHYLKHDHTYFSHECIVYLLNTKMVLVIVYKLRFKMMDTISVFYIPYFNSVSYI